MTQVYNAAQEPAKFQRFCIEQGIEEMAQANVHWRTCLRWLDLCRASERAEKFKKGSEEGPGVNPGDLT